MQLTTRGLTPGQHALTAGFAGQGNLDYGATSSAVDVTIVARP